MLDRVSTGSRSLERPKTQQSVAPKVALLPEYLEPWEIEGLMADAPHPEAALLMLTMWRAGLRISEAVALAISDVQGLGSDSNNPAIRVRRGKGNRPRMVPLHDELRGALYNAMTYGRLNQRFFRCHRTTAWTWVKKAVAASKARGHLATDRPVKPHTLRHSAARHWLASGIPINVVQRWLGHKRLQTTLIYLEILPDQLGLMERVP